MTARPGGEADKFGFRYEGAWTVHHLLLVLAGRAEAITVEDVGEIAKGSEFTLLRNATTEVHQVKRQHGSANGWTPRALDNEHVLGNVGSTSTCGVNSTSLRLSRRSRSIRLAIVPDDPQMSSLLVRGQWLDDEGLPARLRLLGYQ